MNIAFLVVSGSYSDYQVHAVFLTRERAEAYATALDVVRGDSHDEHEVQERPLEPTEALTLAAEGLSLWEVWFRDDRAGAMAVSPHEKIRARVRVWRNERWFDFTLAARDKDHAIKIASEKRAGFLASGRPLPQGEEWVEF